MNTPAAPIDRHALRRNEPAALATILVGQLTAYRCSTVYAPSASRFDAFINTEVLPRLREKYDVRTVVVERWDKKKGPSVAQLVDEIHRQLEIEPADPDAKPLAALESALLRADRRSDRAILIVLYRLEQLLDKKRVPAEVAQFVDALARMAQMPMNGLHLVLGVKEADLGAFRELLRGRWRLLGNDIRIRPAGKQWLLSLPLVIAAYVSGKTAVVAAIAGACAGTGAAVGAVAGAQLCDQREALAACRDENVRLRGARTPEPPPPELPPTPEPDASTGDTSTGEPALASTGDVFPPDAPLADPTAGGEPDAATSTGAATPPVEPPPLPDVAKKVDMCAPVASDGACGKCVRGQCCEDLKACKKSKWRTCVLKGRIGEDDCQPEPLEIECRKLALCALEYTCRADCFNH